MYIAKSLWQNTDIFIHRQKGPHNKLYNQKAHQEKYILVMRLNAENAKDENK